MTSQPSLQTTTIHILPRSHEDNQKMKFGHLIKYKTNIFLKNHAENESAKLVPDLFNFLKKLYIR